MAVPDVRKLRSSKQLSYKLRKWSHGHVFGPSSPDPSRAWNSQSPAVWDLWRSLKVRERNDKSWARLFMAWYSRLYKFIVKPLHCFEWMKKFTCTWEFRFLFQQSGFIRLCSSAKSLACCIYSRRSSCFIAFHLSPRITLMALTKQQEHTL